MVKIGVGGGDGDDGDGGDGGFDREISAVHGQATVERWRDGEMELWRPS